MIEQAIRSGAMWVHLNPGLAFMAAGLGALVWMSRRYMAPKERRWRLRDMRADEKVATAAAVAAVFIGLAVRLGYL